MIKNKPLELYFHIPFCVQKCLYCDFLSGVYDEETQNAYMKALLKEVTGRAKECSDYQVQSIFIGGGTPAVVAADWMEVLLSTVRECFDLAQDAEISIEANPGTVDYEKLSRYRAAGINRLSIGLQSAHDEELKALGRIHTFGQFQDAYRWAGQAGFDNINVDIMSALPNQTPEAFKQTLQAVLSLTPPPVHISAYSLIVEEGTAFAKFKEQGRLNLPTEEQEREMYWETHRILTQAGYEHYEISNYALRGYACKHNCGYWSRKEYLGFGIGAASLFLNRRFTNGSDMAKYLQTPLSVRSEATVLSRSDRMEEFMFLGLRLLGGVCTREFEEAFGVAIQQVYGRVIEKNIQDGLLTFDEKGGYLAFTERGIDVSNYVLAQFLF